MATNKALIGVTRITGSKILRFYARQDLNILLP